MVSSTVSKSLYYFNDTAVSGDTSVKFSKNEYLSDTNYQFILRCKRELENNSELVAFVLSYRDNSRTEIIKASFKTSINNAYYKPDGTRGQQIYVLEENNDSVNTILLDDGMPLDNGPILYVPEPEPEPVNNIQETMDLIQGKLVTLEEERNKCFTDIKTSCPPGYKCIPSNIWKDIAKGIDGIDIMIEDTQILDGDSPSTDVNIKELSN